MINGRTRLHVVANGTMTGQRYIDEVLLPHVRLFRGAVGDKFVFMDDNATCHRTLAVQDCLDSKGIQRLVWPARSPDLNPIENVWDALGRQVAGRNYPPTNKNTLIRALTEEWDKLPQQLLDNVVQSMKPQEWSYVLFSEESKFTRLSDSHRVFIWRESGARFQHYYVTKIDRFGSKLVIVCVGVMLGSCKPLYVFGASTVNSQCYRDIMEVYGMSFWCYGPGLYIFMDDNIGSYRTHIVAEFLEGVDIRRIDWISRSPDQSSVEHIWDGLADFLVHPRSSRSRFLYLQVDGHVHPGNCLAAVSSEKKQDLLHMEFYHHLPSWDMNEQMSYFSSFSDEWSRDLKSVQVLKQLSCREIEKFSLKKIDLIQLARDLDESPDPSMSKIVLRNLIISSKYYKEEEAKELLEVITAERIANQSANQNNGQTSRVKSLDEIVKMVRLLTVKVPNKSDGWEYFFSSLEKAFASEMVSDELKPKVLLCMLGDKVSNLLVNLGEEELKDYESLKQVVLKEYEPSPPKICLENFRKAKRNSDETFSQFASRLTSMWLYYCKLREANDFESVKQLIVADKMFEMLDSETATHIGVLQGEEWYKPRDLGKQCDIFYASKGKSYDEPEKAKWNDSEKRSFNGSWGKQPFGEKSQIIFLLGKTWIKVKWEVSPCVIDSGTEITVIKKDLVPGISVEGASTIYLKGIFGPAVKCPLVYVPIGLATGGQVNVVHQQVLCALAEVLVEDVLLPPEVLDMLGGAQSEENSLAQSSQDLRVDSGNVDETEVSSGILPEKAQEHIEDSQRNITSCRNEVGTLGTKDEEVTA
ncbi:retrovirus-related Pol polyprotein from transposon opus [Trichonephila clavipes]|nr:retrovirus-related Pol polyprotein from transposon opus [Trichonephila clavipes]